MKKLTILVDMDDTIELLVPVWVERLNKKYNRNAGFEDITDWEMKNAYPDLTFEDLVSVVDDTIWEEVEPIEGAAEALQRLIAQGHDVYIVTATYYEHVKAKMENLLFRYFPFISWEQVVLTNNKQLLSGDVMIDDGLHNLIGGNYRKIVMDAPYNRDVDDEKYELLRAYNWDDIEKYINMIAEDD